MTDPSILNTKNAIGIANFALSQLSIDPIASFDEKTKSAKEMARNFQIAKETILREYVFDWAHRAEKLIAYNDDQGGYQKPNDYINFIGLGDACSYCCCSSEWKNLTVFTHKASVRQINGRLYIDSCCCDSYDTLHYSFNNQNYADISADLFEIIGYKLAYISAMQITRNQSLVEFVRERLEFALQKARMHEGLEHKPISNKPGYAGYPLGPKCGGFF